MTNLRKIFISIAFFWGFNTGVSADVEINETTFPDEEFRSWILRQSYGADGLLTEEEIANVTRIMVVGGRDIQSLKGIEYFTALTYLNCASNHLTELDVSRNTALTTLYCDNNQLNSLDVSKNTALKKLVCGDNPLTTLDVSMNTELTDLACSRSQLTTLDVSKNIALTSLSCHYNLLTSLDVSKNTALINLFCHGNPLTSLDVSKNPALMKFVCENSQLTSLNVSGCVALESLICSGNRLTELDVTGCTELEEISCYSNRIKGEAMDELVESLPTINNGHGMLAVIDNKDEQNVMTKSQVAAAKAKGWYVRYNDSNDQWQNYEGSDDPTGLVSPLGETEEGAIFDLQGRRITGKPARGIYIEDGKKKVMK